MTLLKLEAGLVAAVLWCWVTMVLVAFAVRYAPWVLILLPIPFRWRR